MNDTPDPSPATRLLWALRQRAAICRTGRAEPEPAGHDDAAAILVEVVPPIVQAELRKRGANPADVEDIISRVELACWTGRSDAQSEGEAVGFVRTVARNAFFDLCRASGRHPGAEPGEDLCADPAPDLVHYRALIRIQRRLLAAIVQSGHPGRFERAHAFLAHRLDPEPPPDDPGPPTPKLERVRIANKTQKARSEGRKYLLEMIRESPHYFDEEELRLIEKILGEDLFPSEADTEDRPIEENAS